MILLISLAAVAILCMVGMSSCSFSTRSDAKGYSPSRTDPRSDSASRPPSNDEVLLVPHVEGGRAGWCLIVAPLRPGGCKQPGTSDSGPIVTETWRVESPPPTADGIALTRSEVAAVSVNGGSEIPTRAESGLPAGLRAVAVEVHGKEHGVEPGINAPFPNLIPLNAEGQPLPPPTSLPTPLSVKIPSRHWHLPAKPPDGSCKTSATDLAGAEAQSGTMVLRIRPSRGLIGQAFLTCVNTQYELHRWRLEAWVLLDAAHPGLSPAPLPAMKHLSGQRAIFTAPGAEGEMVARRVRYGWLAIGGGSGLQQRLTLLEHLSVMIQL